MIKKMPDGYETQLGRMFGNHTLSGGQWQKIAIARTFAREAALLILDEPTKGIDIGSKAAVHEFMAELAAQGSGATP